MTDFTETMLQCPYIAISSPLPSHPLTLPCFPVSLLPCFQYAALIVVIPSHDFYFLGSRGMQGERGYQGVRGRDGSRGSKGSRGERGDAGLVINEHLTFLLTFLNKLSNIVLYIIHKNNKYIGKKNIKEKKQNHGFCHIC